MIRGRRRQITDAQIAKLRAWHRGMRIELRGLAMQMGIDPSYASQLRLGRYTHRQESPK